MRLTSLLILVIAMSLSLSPAAAQCDFSTKVKVLDGPPPFTSNFSIPPPPPPALPRNYVGPTVRMPNGGEANEVNLLLAAFQIAPQWLKDDLCDPDLVDTVIIDPISYAAPAAGEAAEFGWAFWETKRQVPGPGKKRQFIGISSGALTNNLLLSTLETNIVDALLSLSPGTPQTPTVEVTLVNAQGNPVLETQEWAILAILAHEMGHLFWYDVCDGKQDQTNQQGCNQHFHTSGWTDINHPWTGIRQFGDAISGAVHKPNPLIPDPDAIRNDRWPYPLLLALYGGNTWSDMFSFIAPDEEIAEAYKFMALMEAKNNVTGTTLASMTIKVDPATPASLFWQSPIIARLKAPGLLKDKINLIRACVPRSATPPPLCQP